MTSTFYILAHDAADQRRHLNSIGSRISNDQFIICLFNLCVYLIQISTTTWFNIRLLRINYYPFHLFLLFRFGNRTEASILRSIRLIYTVCGMSNDGWPMAPTICRLGDAMRTTQMVAVRIICSLTAEIIYPIYRQRNSHGWDYSNATYIP